jgi:uncharacterized protein
MRWYMAIPFILMSGASLAAPPSSCAGEHSAIGRLICSDDELRAADNEVYGGLNAWRSNVMGAERDVRNQSHGDWIRARNERCGVAWLSPDTPLETLMAAKPCLLKAYQERKKFYDSVMWN